MGKQTPSVLTFESAGISISLEHGKLAALADGSVLLRQGNLMMLATAVSAPEAKADQGFFPLTVEYREKFASTGRIPGNFFRREARPSDDEILTARLIDRAIRPLFPDNYMNETQVFVYLISADKDSTPDAYAALAASMALMTSDIPFAGPISEVRIVRIDGQFIVNPKRSDLKKADMDFVVAGSMDSICMVEGEAKECSESDLVEAIRIAHVAIQEHCKAQIEFRKQLGKTEVREVPVRPRNEEIEKEIYALTFQSFYDIAKSASSKLDRRKRFSEVKETMMAALVAKFGEETVSENAKIINAYIDDLQRDTVRELILAEKLRLDGRGPTDIRPIWAEVDYLPSTHGSSVFTRGETQSLTTVTLGSKLDEALIDTVMEMYNEKFLLHYNFPPFSTNEAKPIRGISRREVGHGNLARRSLLQVLPVDFPYTVRVVSDILESNGSSSMATVCAGSLALMDAGVPVRAAVSGIAMGLITDGKGRTVVLSDILGDEDHLGDMDFKVTGTANGICGCQMDIKINGIDYQLFTDALAQARQGRLHILGVMNQTLAAPNADLKPHAPRIQRVEIPGDSIGGVIGSGGKVIQAIQAETQTTVNIEEADGKGIVSVMGVGKDSIERAIAMIVLIANGPEIGKTYTTKVVKVMPFGAFVEYAPGKDGLVHISDIAWRRLETVEEELNTNDIIEVQFLGADDRGKLKFSRKALIPKPEGYQERPPRTNNQEGGGYQQKGGYGDNKRFDRKPPYNNR